MRWGDMRRSDNVEDVTGGQPSGGGVPFGGGMKLGGGAMILIVIVSLLFGVNPLQFLGMMEGGAPVPAPAPVPQSAPPGYGPQVQSRQAAKGAEDPDKALSRARAGRHRGRLVGAVPGDGVALRATQARRSSASRSCRCAAGRARPPVLSIVPATASSTSTRRSSRNLRTASARRAISPRRMSSRTKSATTCRT